MSYIFKGISYPFRFGSTGGIAKSELSVDDQSRIYESIYQIIFTYKNERVNANDFGSNIRKYLFEPFDDITTLSLIKFDITKAITEQEPRVEVIDVRVYTEPDEDSKIYIDLDLLIIQFSKEVTMSYEYNREIT